VTLRKTQATGSCNKITKLLSVLRSNEALQSLKSDVFVIDGI